MSCQAKLMALDLEERLQARKFPVSFSYGPDRVKVTNASYEVNIRRDDEAGDNVTPAKGQLSNPRRFAIRHCGVVASVRVTSPMSGAMLEEHEADCDLLVDALLTELFKWFTEAKAGELVIGESRYLTREERDNDASGVEYVLRFELPRAVLERDYAGAARPTARVSKVSTTSFVRLEGTEREEI